ncbi:TRAP transporter small permease [Marinomonas transparens]|uniref:TRAP transporter small permease protein n=1 Tax=Marinomonas transparens TaxID=2795388 RepID=A0A934JN09_9GAMM|nr:TRAP transporter small permease [Marinomonas transparens]MBJ7537433.1 TRAP transporter small permease [Marinomonas transparens]
MTTPIRRRDLTKIGNLLSKVADSIGALFFLIAFVGFLVQIFYRYALNDPIRWTEEVIMIVFIWAVFWAAAFMVPIKNHVTLEVVYSVVPKKTKRIFAIISMFTIILAFIILIPATIEYLDFLTRKKSPVLRLPMHWIYSCYLLFLVGFTIKSSIRLWKLFGSDWRSNI